MSYQSSSTSKIRIDPECLFCGNPTNETQTYSLVDGWWTISGSSTTTMRIPIPAHSICFEKATKVEHQSCLLLIATFAVPFLTMFILELLANLIYSAGCVGCTDVGRVRGTNMYDCLFFLLAGLIFLVLGFNYLRANLIEKEFKAKIKGYYESHRIKE